MSYLERLHALGATSVGGDLYLKHTHLGSSRNGDFLISPAGLALLGHALPVFALELSAPTLELQLERAVQVHMQDESVSAQLSEPNAASGETLAAGKPRTKGRPKKQAPFVADYAAGANIEIEI